MKENNKEPLIPMVDQYSKDLRISAEINAEIELKRLQEKDSRFNDPMMAYKFLKESQIAPW